MRVAIKVPEVTIPEAGELWKHPGQVEIYLHINDEDGQRAMERPEWYFYSVRIRDGKIVSTDRDAEFRMLQPVGGEPLMLEVKP